MATEQTPPDLWCCGVCFDDYNAATEQPIEIDGDSICRECASGKLVEAFELALANEFEPARWGETILDPRQYAEWLGPEFMARWDAKQEERGVPVKDRVYCRHRVAERPGSVGEAVKLLGETTLTETKQGDGEAGPAETSWTECNRFVGQLSSSGVPVFVSCSDCKGLVCLNCKAALSATEAHDYCHPIPSPTLDELFPALERGKHYQHCPKCSLQLERKDGCNHMTCAACQEDFCFICGVVATAESGHWQRVNSTCPKYNHPSDANAIFEEDIEQDEDDDNSDTESYEGDGLMGLEERITREEYPEIKFTLFDDMPMDAEMVEAAALPPDVHANLIDARAFFFLDFSTIDMTARRPWPEDYVRAHAHGYRLLRMQVELALADHEFVAAAARRRYLEDWEVFTTAMGRLPREWSVEEQEALRELDRVVVASHEGVKTALEDCVLLQAASASATATPAP